MSDDVGRLHRDLEVYRGDTFIQDFAFLEDGNSRYIDDLVVSSGSTSATSDTAEFVGGDNGKVIATFDDTLIADGTTMTYVSPTEVTLSVAATGDSDGAVALVRALDCSNFTDHLSQARTSADDADQVDITVDDSRSDVGLFTLTIDAADTATLPAGVWDWQCQGPDGTLTWAEGKVRVTKDVTR